jgi:hypothetical protein
VVTGKVDWMGTGGQPPTSGRVARVDDRNMPLSDFVATDAQGRFELELRQDDLLAARDVTLLAEAKAEPNLWYQTSKDVHLTGCKQDIGTIDVR